MDTNTHKIQPQILKVFIAAIKSEFKDENWDYLDFIADRVIGKQPTETNTPTNTVEEAAIEYATKIVKNTHYNEEEIHLEYAFKNGASWQKEQDEAKYKALEESHAELLSKLEQATERMTRARGILNREDGQSNWGMLDCSDFKEIITNAKNLKP